MAKVRRRDTRRHRVQFSMSSQLWAKYDMNIKTAGKLNVEIDFSTDFERWFTSQNEQVEGELARIKADQASGNSKAATNTGIDNGAD